MTSTSHFRQIIFRYLAKRAGIAYAADSEFTLATHHAPAGHTKDNPLMIGGKPYISGQFIPGDVLAKATPEEKAQLEKREGNAGVPRPELKVRHHDRAEKKGTYQLQADGTWKNQNGETMDALEMISKVGTDTYKRAMGKHKKALEEAKDVVAGIDEPPATVYESNPANMEAAQQASVKAKEATAKADESGKEEDHKTAIEAHKEAAVLHRKPGVDYGELQAGTHELQADVHEIQAIKAASVTKIPAVVEPVAEPATVATESADAAKAAADRKAKTAATKAAKHAKGVEALAKISLNAKDATSYNGKKMIVLRGEGTKPFREIIKKHGGTFWGKDKEGRQDPRWHVMGERSIRALIDELTGEGAEESKKAADEQRASDAKFAEEKKEAVKKRVDLRVSYSDKDKAKALGARWDPLKRTWYAPTQEIADAVNQKLNPPKPPPAEKPPVPPAPTESQAQAVAPMPLLSSGPTPEAAASHEAAQKASAEQIHALAAKHGRTLAPDAKPRSFQRTLGHGKRAEVERRGGLPEIGEVIQGSKGPVMVVGVGKPEFVSDDWIEDMDAWSTYPDGPGWYGHYQAVPVERNEAEHAVEKKKTEKIEAHAKIKTVANEIRKTGERPDGMNSAEGEEIPIGGMNHRLYGGGEWFTIGPEWIWHVENNGSDGSDWSYNNVRTGGAGAIGTRVPYTPELAEQIRTLAKTAELTEANK